MANKKITLKDAMKNGKVFEPKIVTYLKKKYGPTPTAREQEIIDEKMEDIGIGLERMNKFLSPYMEKVYFDRKTNTIYLFREDYKENDEYGSIDELIQDLAEFFEKRGVKVSSDYLNKSALNVQAMTQLLSNS